MAETAIEEVEVIQEGDNIPVQKEVTSEQGAAIQYSEEDIPDDLLVKLLEKRSGRKIKSLDELKPEPSKPSKEDLEQEAKNIEKEAHAWAFGTGKIKKDHYEEAIKEKAKSDRDISFSLFAAEMREDDPKLEDSDIEQMYQDAYREDLEESSPLRKSALKKIKKEAADYRSKFNDVDQIVEDYKKYKSNADRQKAYKKTVKEIVKTLPREISVDIPFDNEGKQEVKTYKVPVDDAVYDKIIKKYDSGEAFFGYGLDNPEANIDEQALHGEFNEQMESLSMGKVIKEVVSQHEKFMMAHMKGIPGAQGKGKITDKFPEPVKPSEPSYFEQKQEENRKKYKI